MYRFWKTSLILAIPFLSLAADEIRPACSSENQGHMWPEAANHDPKLISHLLRCGELLICVHGSWHYHWEAPAVRLDQLGRHAKSNSSKPPVCEAEAIVDAPLPTPAPAALQR
jgi:hypothetical protein